MSKQRRLVWTIYQCRRKVREAIAESNAEQRVECSQEVLEVAALTGGQVQIGMEASAGRRSWEARTVGTRVGRAERPMPAGSALCYSKLQKDYEQCVTCGRRVQYSSLDEWLFVLFNCLFEIYCPRVPHLIFATFTHERSSAGRL